MNRDGFYRVAARILNATPFVTFAVLMAVNSGTTIAQTDNQFQPSAHPERITPSQNDATFTPDPYYSSALTLDSPMDSQAGGSVEWNPPGNSTHQNRPAASLPSRLKNQVRSLMENETWEPPLTPVTPAYDSSKLTHSPIPWLQQPAPQPSATEKSTAQQLAAQRQGVPEISLGDKRPTPVQPFKRATSIIRPNSTSLLSSGGHQKVISNDFAKAGVEAAVKPAEPTLIKTPDPTLETSRATSGGKTGASSVSGVARRNDRDFAGRSDFVPRTIKTGPSQPTVELEPPKIKKTEPIARNTFVGKAQPLLGKTKPKKIDSFGSLTSPSSNKDSVSTPATTRQTASSPANSTVRPVDAETFEPTQLLALVGGEPIFVGDALLQVNQLIEQHMGNAPESAKARERRGLIKRILPKMVDEKILYVGALQDLPEEADIEQIVASAAKEFDEKALPDLLKRAKLKDAADYDKLLRSMGSSLRKRRDAWARDQLTRYFIGEQLDLDREITHQQLLEEYRANVEQYKIAEKSKWEQIMVRFDRFSHRDEAHEEIVALGNRLVNGASLPALAKKSSHGFRADEGGQHDWTGRNALVLKEIDKAIFSLPIGKLSDVIETRDGLHIVRVIDRQEAGIKPFTEAQADIKKRLKVKMREDAFEQHLAKLKKKIPVEYFNFESNEVASRDDGSFLE
jgi:parvulin-like peptidyl-prolyl isomerase